MDENLSDTAVQPERPGLRHSNNRILDLSDCWPADADSDGTIPPPDRSTHRSTDRSAPRSAERSAPVIDPAPSDVAHAPGEYSLAAIERAGRLEDLSTRDSTLIYLTVLLRLVAYDDLRALLFRHQHDAQVRKTVLRLDRAGWVSRWNVRVPRVGRLGHIHPTTRALRATLPRLLAVTTAEPWFPLIRLMIPRTPRSPLDLGPTRPKWFAHQREVNGIAASLLLARRTLWISTWDAPFPPAAQDEIAFPQPDYVCIAVADHGPEVVFGEHDRGTEPLDRFRNRKLRAYARLAARAEALLGISTFRVRVTVSEDAPGGMQQRLARLRNEAHVFGSEELYDFAAMPLRS